MSRDWAVSTAIKSTPGTLMLVLDTDQVTEYQRGTSAAAQRLNQRLDSATGATGEGFDSPVLGDDQHRESRFKLVTTGGPKRPPVTPKITPHSAVFLPWTVPPRRCVAPGEYPLLRRSELLIKQSQQSHNTSPQLCGKVLRIFQMLERRAFDVPFKCVLNQKVGGRSNCPK